MISRRLDCESLENRVCARLRSAGKNDVKYQSPQTDNTVDSCTSQGLSFNASFGCPVFTLNKLSPFKGSDAYVVFSRNTLIGSSHYFLLLKERTCEVSLV